LTQEVAYNSLLIERRRLLHERAGEAIEGLYAERLDDHLSELARHYQRSTNINKALEYLRRAGQQAVQRSSHAEAIGLFTSALELLRTLPERPQRLEQELALQLGLGAALTTIKGWSAPEVGRAFARARVLCRQMAETPHLFPALAGLWAFYVVRAELEPALDLAKQLLSIAQSAKDAALLPAAHHAMGHTLYVLGQFMPARTHLELSYSLDDPAQYQAQAVPYFGCDLAVHTLMYTSWNLCVLGFPDQAVETVDKAMGLARELTHPFSLCMALHGSGFVHCVLGEAKAASNNADALCQIANQQGFQVLLGLGVFGRGWALIADDRADEGMVEVGEAMDSLRAHDLTEGLTAGLAVLVTGCHMAGLLDKGFATLAEAMAHVEGTGERFWEAELYRLKVALFGAPVAHEDHPQRAVHAAITMRDALRRRGGDRLDRPGVEVRIGINTGEVVLRLIHTGGHTEYTPVGHAANLAARMQSVATAGGIVISGDTKSLVEGYFELRESAPTEVKGVAEPINIYEVIGAGPLHSHFELSMRRGLTKFVGRDREIVEMKRTLELVLGGHGQIVAVVAEAGTGKSRLFYEFKATLPPGCKVLEAYSVSYGKASAWLPVLELLRGYFDIQEVDDPATRREKVRAALGALDPALSETQSYLFSLLAIADSPDPLAQMHLQVKRTRTMEALKRIVLRESLKQLVVVIFEDLHWVDGETQALLDLLADGIANARILLLVNYRPEYRHEWGGKSYYTQLRLDPLGRESTEEMLGTLLGEPVELTPLKRLVAEKTGGNPFFIEELVQALFDEGALVRNGMVRVARPLSQLRLPPTVQGILASRIDRLAGKHKQLLQALAVMGKESPLALIRKVVSPAGGELERMLAELQAGEFIYEQPAAADVEYRFKHALTQQVAYNSLLIERRKLLHERAGEALESLFGEQLDDHLSELAHHYSHSDNVNKAVEYLGRAGQQAMQRSAFADAIRNLGATIDLLPRLADGSERLQRELLLQLALGWSSYNIKGWGAPETERAYTRARELCAHLGDPPELFPALFGLWPVYLTKAELGAAYALAEQLLRRAEAAHDSGLLLYALHAIGETSYFMGRFLPARRHLEMAMPVYDAERHSVLTSRYSGPDAGVWNLCTVALVLWALGYPDLALERANEAVALSQRLSHRYSPALAEYAAASVHHERGEVDAAQKSAERVIALCSEFGFTDLLAFTNGLHGSSLAKQGRSEEGIAKIREGLSVSRTTGAQLALPIHLTYLAEACIEARRFDDGLNALAEALTIANEREYHAYEAEAHRLKGELLLRQDQPTLAEAQSCFQRAIEIARNQSAKSWELRATTSLARLLADQGRRDEARLTLAEIYNWFTEGFDTRDLKEAKALLDDLSV
jgi:predicted ATPase/class 3 adenylate cyclase